MTTNEALFKVMATESDIEARRSMEAIPFLVLLSIISAIAWAYALSALIDLMGVL
jgi:hypothetical protein